MRGRQLPLLVSCFARTPGWRPLVPMIVCAAGLLAWADLDERARAALWLLRVTAVLLALGVTFALDDPAAAVTAPVPTRLGVRRAVPVAVMVAAVGVAWGVLLSYAVAWSPSPLPIRDLTVELGALVLLALAMAACLGGFVAGPVLVVGLLLALRLPQRFTLLGGAPGDGVWAAAHQRWLLLAVIASAALMWVSQDPASRPGSRR